MAVFVFENAAFVAAVMVIELDMHDVVAMVLVPDSSAMAVVGVLDRTVASVEVVEPDAFETAVAVVVVLVIFPDKEMSGDAEIVTVRADIVDTVVEIARNNSAVLMVSTVPGKPKFVFPGLVHSAQWDWIRKHSVFLLSAKAFQKETKVCF